MVRLLQTAGTIRTNIFKDLGVNESNADQFFDTLKNAALVDRIGTVADISAAIVYLASESFVTGTTLIVDGGLTCVGIPGKSIFIATLSHCHVFSYLNGRRMYRIARILSWFDRRKNVTYLYILSMYSMSCQKQLYQND